MKTSPEAVKIVKYCVRCEFEANASDKHIIGRGLFARMVCSGCGEIRPIYVFALVKKEASDAAFKKHRHVNNGIDDGCKQCGRDLRDEVHARVFGVVLKRED